MPSQLVQLYQAEQRIQKSVSHYITAVSDCAQKLQIQWLAIKLFKLSVLSWTWKVFLESKEYKSVSDYITAVGVCAQKLQILYK